MPSRPLPLAMNKPVTDRIALVVEDGLIFRMEAVGLMEDAGFVVLEAATGSEALRHLEGATAAVLVTDVRMPGDIDGFALAREVAERWPDVGIVVMSAERSPGPDDLPAKAVFVPKPFTPNILLGAVRKVVGPA